MRITIIGTFPPFRGGIADFNLAMAIQLSKHHKVTAVNFTVQYPPIFFPGKSQLKPGNGGVQFPNQRILSSINPFTWKKTINVITLLEPDLVIFRYWMPFFSPAFRKIALGIKKGIGSKILAVCDNIYPHEKRIFDKKLTQYFFNEVDYFLVLSRHVESDLIDLYPDAVYRYSPHPVYDIFGKGIPKDTARKKLDIHEEKIILYFGVIRPYKGLDILIKSAYKLKKMLNNFKILAVGECYEDTNKYKKLISELDVEDVFDLRPDFIPDSEVSAYFSSADIVALPYKSATQSGIVQIAYHFNKPVIVTNVGGLPEIVMDQKVGFIIEPDPDSMAQAIRKFYEEDCVSGFSENVKIYKDRFSWNHLVQKIEELASL